MSMTETTENESKPMDLVPNDAERAFALSQREATALARNDIVPKAFQGNVPNCLIALNLARRIGADPLMIMQNLHVIHGRPAFSATFLVACINMSGDFSRLQYRIEGEGEERTCVAYATEKSTGEVVEGPPVSIGMAIAEGWATKNGSKWKTMPDLMLRYRAAAFFARTIAPEVAMGLYTSDELDDIRASERSSGASATSAADALANARDITPEGDHGGPSSDVPDSEPEAGSSDGTGGPSPATPSADQDEIDAALYGNEPDAA